MDPVHIRVAKAEDIDTLLAHRRNMFHDMGYTDEAALEAMTAAFLPWVRRRMETGEYLAWVAADKADSIVAGLGLWLMDWPPQMIGPGARRGNILNVYTNPSHRRQGIARSLMGIALDWCRSNGIRAVILHASEDGRPLYESLGFQPANEMRLLISAEERLP
jgi:GNAT superfamily N-acetyltransferase